MSSDREKAITPYTHVAPEPRGPAIRDTSNTEWRFRNISFVYACDATTGPVERSALMHAIVDTRRRWDKTASDWGFCLAEELLVPNKGRVPNADNFRREYLNARWMGIELTALYDKAVESLYPSEIYEAFQALRNGKRIAERDVWVEAHLTMEETSKAVNTELRSLRAAYARADENRSALSSENNLLRAQVQRVDKCANAYLRERNAAMTELAAMKQRVHELTQAVGKQTKPEPAEPTMMIVTREHLAQLQSNPHWSARYLRENPEAGYYFQSKDPELHLRDVEVTEAKLLWEGPPCSPAVQFPADPIKIGDE